MQDQICPIYKTSFKCLLLFIHSVVSAPLWPKDYSLKDPLSMGFPRQEYWSGLPFPSPRDLSNWIWVFSSNSTTSGVPVVTPLYMQLTLLRSFSSLPRLVLLQFSVITRPAGPWESPATMRRFRGIATPVCAPVRDDIKMFYVCDLIESEESILIGVIDNENYRIVW